jgi:excisionase family DNA binding protein
MIMLKTTNEIGDIYGISTSYVRKLISRGVIKAKKVGGMYLIDNDKIAKIERIRQPPIRNRKSGLPKKAKAGKRRIK